MAFLINGTPLDNPDLGWTVQKGTIPVTAVQLESTSSSQAGRDGIVPGPSTRKPGTMRFVVASSTATRGDLLALVAAPQLVITDSALPGRTATGKLLSSSPVTYLGYDDWGEDLFVVEIHEGCWRGELATSAMIPAAPGGAVASVFPGLSAPVQDAIIRLRGPLTNPQLLDAGGAFLAVDGTLEVGQYLRFDSSSGRAWTTTEDAWLGGDEVSGLVDYGGPRGVFEITPSFTSPADPRARSGRLTLTSDAYAAGAGFQVRGRGAYLL